MKKLFSIYDSKAEVWTMPVPMNSAGEAVRSFSEAANDPETAYGRHGEDFSLFEVGLWDEYNGNIVMHESKIALGLAIELKTQKSLDIDQPELEAVS